MERIPLAQRLGTIDDTGWLIGEYARLFCFKLFPVFNELTGGTDYSGDLELADCYMLAAWLAQLEEIFPGSTPEGQTHLLYRYIVAPFTQIKEKGEMDHE